MEAKSRRIRYAPHPDPKKGMKGEKVKAIAFDFKALKEEWSVYELEDGTRVRIRPSLIAVDVPIDPATDEVMRDKQGSPIYGLQMQVQTSYEIAEKSLDKKLDKK